MKRNGLEEAIRIVLETEGEEGLQSLRRALAQLGDQSAGSADKAGKLAAELEKLATTSTNIRNFTRLKAAMADTGTALEKARQRQRELNAELAASEKPTRKLTQANERAATQVERLTRLQNRQQAELTRTTNALSKAGVDTENLGRAYGDLQAQFGKLGAGAEGAAGSLRKVGRESGSVDVSARKGAAAISKISSGLLAVSGAAVGAATALAAVAAAGTGAFFAGAIRSATTLEDALMEVKAVSGATADEMVALKAAAEAGATSTRFTALEAAQGLGELARATGSATSAIESLPAALNLAQAAGLGVADAAQFITTTLTQFGLGAEQASRVADVLAKAANATTADVRQLGDALTYAAPLAKQLGLDTEDTVAILGALADQGFRGERAGTALRNVFSELLEPSSSFAKALRDLGIESNDFATVIEQLGQSGERGREALQLLDAAARPAIMSLVNTGGAGLRQLEVDLRAAGGAAEETARQMGQSTNAATASVEKSLDRARRALVEPILEPLREELFALSAELEAFAQSPEFAEIKSALTELFIEGAAAARELLKEVDFKALAADIRSFVGDASQSMAELRENMALVVDTVEILGDTFSVIFNGVQTLILGLAAAVTKLLQVWMQVQGVLTFLPRKFMELATGSDAASRQMEETIGGLGAVFDEFAERTGKNLGETVEAFNNLAGANEGAARSAGGLGEVAAASEKAAQSATTHANAARDAAAAMGQQADAAGRTAAASTAAADKAQQDAARLKQAFADLGIESQANLQRAAESARKNFDRIREAVSAGQATAEDARRALAAYAQAALAAVSQSDASARRRVEGEIQVLEAIYDVNRGLGEMGRAGQQAGADVAAGAAQASSALSGVASSAGSAAQGTQEVGEAAWEGRNGLYGAASGSYALAQGFGELSKAAIQAYMATNQTISPLTSGGKDIFPMFNAINNVTDAIRKQKEALDSRLASLQKQSKEFDTLAGKRERLRQQFSFLGDSQIEALVRAEEDLEQKRRQRLAQEQQARDDQRQADLERLDAADRMAEVAGPRIPASDNKLTVVLEYPEPSSGGELSPQERRTADRILAYILPRLTRELARSKSLTVTQRPRAR